MSGESALSDLVFMNKMSSVQVLPLVPRKEKKKKQVKDEMDRRKQAEKKRRRLEKALATSAAIRSELEKKKQKKKEEEQRLDEEGAAIAEAVALHVLCDDLDDSCQIMLNKNDGFGLDSLRDCASNIGAFLGGWKTTAPCLTFGKYYLDGFGCASDAYGSGCKWNDLGIGWSFAPGMIDQDIPELYFEEKGQGAELSPGLIAAQAVSSLQIAEDAHCGTYTGEETATVIINGMLEGGCLGSNNINLYKV